MAVDFSGVQDATLHVLRTVPETRSNDGLLISEVMLLINPSIKGLKFNFVLENRRGLGLPTLETITRARRKVQRNHPELRADKEVEEARAQLEEEYKDFSRKRV